MKTVDIILTAFVAAIIGIAILIVIAYKNDPMNNLKDTDKVRGTMVVGTRAYEITVTGKTHKACPRLMNARIVK